MVNKKAQELGQALVDSSEFQKYLAAKKAVDDDAEATGYLAAYAEKEQELQNKLMEDPTNADILNNGREDLEEIRLKIVNNVIINNLAAAQSDFNSVMQSVNSVITHFINPESSCSSSSCGGNCSGCHK